MNKHWLPLQSIPATGSRLILDDPSIWCEPVHEFGLSCTGVESLRAEVNISPQPEGVLFRGRIFGKVALPCDRCTDDSFCNLDHSFDCFEPFPPESLIPMHDATEQDGREEANEAVIRALPHGRGVEINPSALVWEEFSLALSVKPLCSENCKGLCAQCGCNLNRELCACGQDKGDPRLAALCGLSVKTKK